MNLAALPPTTLQVRSSPHVHRKRSTSAIMWNVTLAAIPAAGFGAYAFGLAAALVLFTSLLSCLLTEHLLSRKRPEGSALGDGSAVVTGLLFGMTLPPGLPLWMVALGGAACIAVGKWVFGGLGANPFNPALVGRALLQAAFPLPMTTWLAPFGAGRFESLPASTLAWPFCAPSAADAMTGATPLSAFKFGGQLTSATDLALGAVSGSVGELSAVLILAGGAYLALRGMMNWRIPLAIFATVAGLELALTVIAPQQYPSALFQLAAGGLALGAVFMATDMVGSPLTHWASILYGVLIGVLTLVIRLWGGMPEGVMYSILLANAAVPHLDRWVQPRVFGTSQRKRGQA